MARHDSYNRAGRRANRYGWRLPGRTDAREDNADKREGRKRRRPIPRRCLPLIGLGEARFAEVFMLERCRGLESEGEEKVNWGG